MAADLEEVVVDSNPLNRKHLGEQRAENLFFRRSRSLPRDRRDQLGRRQRLAIELAVFRQRQRLQFNDGRRRHIAGQPLRHLPANRGRIDARARRRHDVAHQPLLARRVLSRDDNRLRDFRTLLQRRLDLARLDSKAPNLDLLIGSPQELKVVVHAPARQVSSPVHPRSGLAVWIGNKAFSRQCGPLQIASRQAGAGDVEFPSHSHRNWLQRPIKHVKLVVRQRLSDRH